jgi:hypothetical protein
MDAKQLRVLLIVEIVRAHTTLLPLIRFLYPPQDNRPLKYWTGTRLISLIKFAWALKRLEEDLITGSSTLFCQQDSFD